ncbi:MAG: hypothetical protein JO165_08020 [Candidatus Eremiobacteraeota bacterium]|nr:hypothetical protein [Candidatus Eremiobacteraeota bacterium]
MTGTNLYIVIAVVIIAVILIAVIASQRAKSARLQHRFGPEYDRAVEDTGDRAAAEKELASREARVRKLHLEELPAGARDRYAEEWRTVQTRFVDQPQSSLGEADKLVSNVMRDRGYPMEDFDQRIADISPDHPAVVENYRAAHAIATRSETGEVTTEDLRQAMVHYRTLFNDLLGTDERTAR